MATLINTITVSNSPALVETGDFTSATSTLTNYAEEFEADVSAADGNWYIEISNVTSSNAVAVELVAGDYAGAASIPVGTINGGQTAVLYADSVRCRLKNGKVRIKITPKANVSLLSCDVKLHAVQFLPVKTN